MSYQSGTEEVDVLVAGAGPSGSSAASLLSEAGYSVLMLERKMEIGSPVVCADLVNLSFAELEAIRNDQRIFIKSLKELKVAGPSRLLSFSMLPSSGEGDAFNSVVERDRLDKELASKALMNGTRLRIRSELIQFEETDGGVLARYRSGGKTMSIRAEFMVTSTGVVGGPGNLPAVHNNIQDHYSYSRRIGTKDETSLFRIGEGRELTYSVSRFNNEYNTLLINSSEDQVRDGITEVGDAIITGSLSTISPAEFQPGSSRVLNVGSYSGLKDPFFLTGFREAYMSGQLAAKSIMESDSKPEGATSLYTSKVESQMLPRISASYKLRNLVENALGEKIDAFVQYLSGFHYREISVMELIKAASLNDSELREMLPPAH